MLVLDAESVSANVPTAIANRGDNPLAPLPLPLPRSVPRSVPPIRFTIRLRLRMTIRAAGWRHTVLALPKGADGGRCGVSACGAAGHHPTRGMLPDTVRSRVLLARVRVSGLLWPDAQDDLG